MNKKLISSILSFVFLLFQSSLLACICGITSASFTGGVDKKNDNIALVKIFNSGRIYSPDWAGRLISQQYTDVLVVDHLHGEVKQDTLRLMGGDGFSCQTSLYGPIGDTILLNFQGFASTIENGFDSTLQARQPCVVSTVGCKNDTLFGSIAFQIEKMAYQEFKQQFENLITAIPDYGVFVFLIKPGEAGKSKILKKFPIQINNVSYRANNLDWFLWSFQSEERKFDLRFEYSKSGESSRGIDTKDLILLQKHILGIEELNDPYQLLAADVNQSGKISILDLIQLQKLILRKRSQLPNGNDWILVPVHFRFNNPKEPWKEDLPKEHRFKSSNHSSGQLQLIAIKVGDLDNSY